MITGLLFTLAQRQAPSEGRAFPGKPGFAKPAPGRASVANSENVVVKLARNAGAALALVGLLLLSVGGADWSFDPATGLNIQTAVISFTLPAGVFS